MSIKHAITFGVLVEYKGDLDVLASAVSEVLGFSLNLGISASTRDSYLGEVLGMNVELRLDYDEPCSGYMGKRIYFFIGHVRLLSVEERPEWIDMSVYIAETLNRSTEWNWRPRKP